MYFASQAFKDGMKLPFRHRGYISLSIGLNNQVLQNSDNNYVFGASEISASPNTILSNSEYTEKYATWETNSWPTNDNRIILKDSDPLGYIVNQGVVMSPLSNENGQFPYPQRILFKNSSGAKQDLKQITIDWDTVGGSFPKTAYIEFTDENDQHVSFKYIYPTKVSGEVYTVDGIGFNALSINVTDSYTPFTRARVSKVVMGSGLTFNNEDIISSTLTRSASAISAEVPKNTLEVRIQNIDRRFDDLSETSPLNFFQTFQKMDVQYGYDVDGTNNIEWIPGGSYYIKDLPTVSDNELIVTGTSLLEMLTGNFEKGKFTPYVERADTISQAVLNDAGATLPEWVDFRYRIDTALNDVPLNNTLPKDSHKAVLQLISNAARATISVARDGTIGLESTKVVEGTDASNNITFFSQSGKLIDESIGTIRVATWEKDFWRTDGTYFIGDPNTWNNDFYSGVTSSEVTNAEGIFEDTTLATNTVISFNADTQVSGISITFDAPNGNIPTQILVEANRGATPIYSETLANDSTTFMIPAISDQIDELIITPVEMRDAFSRVRFAHINIGGTTGYVLNRYEMSGNAKLTSVDTVKSLGALLYRIEYVADRVAVEEDVSLEPGYTDFYFTRDYILTGAQFTYSNSSVVADVEENFDYVTHIRLYSPGFLSTKITVSGDEVDSVAVGRITKTTGYEGIEDVAENKLIPEYSNYDVSTDYLNWMYDAIVRSRVWEIPFRGDPTLDPLDIIQIELRTGELVYVAIEEVVLTMNGAFGGSLIVREVFING